MTELIEQWVYIRFCIKLEHSSMETIWIIQKAAAMGNWWLAASSQQCTHSCFTFHAEFFGETSNHTGNSAHLQPRFGTLWLLAFPQNNITYGREKFQTTDEIEENTTGQLMETGKTVWDPKVPSLKETGVSLSYVQYFLYFVSPSINVYFS